MKQSIIIFLTSLAMSAHGQISKQQLQQNSNQLINDIIKSTDFSFAERRLENIRNDTDDFIRQINHVNDSTTVDTIITTRYRLSLADWTTITEDTLNIKDKPTSKYVEIPINDSVEFTKFDIAFMLQQEKVVHQIRWDKHLNGTAILNGDKLELLFKTKGTSEGWKTFHNLYGSNLIEFSVPLFNRTFTKAIIVIVFWRGGLDGYGGRFMCELKDGKWVITKTYGPVWVS